MAIRDIEIDWPDTVKTYATADRCTHEAKKLGARTAGMCNVRIVPTLVARPGENTKLRWTAHFSNFTDMRDAMWIAHNGFVVSN